MFFELLCGDVLIHKVILLDTPIDILVDLLHPLVSRAKGLLAVVWSAGEFDI
jgi:hypothetical protein